MINNIKNKVAIITNGKNDIINQRREIVEALLEEGYEIKILCEGGINLTSIFTQSNITFDEISIDRRGTNPIRDGRMFVHYLIQLKEYNPNIILTYTTKPNLYGSLAARILHVPYILNITGLGSTLNRKGLIHSVVLNWYKKAIQGAYCVFYQNNTNKLVFNNMQIFGQHEQLIPGSGVNLKKYKLEPYPESEKIIKFLFVSRILKEKGIEILVEAIKILRDQYNNLEFHVCGSCENGYEPYIRSADQLKYIIYHGPQRDIHFFMKEAHALVHPSFYPEGMSNVCQEAAATGRPVLTTTLPGCQETVDNGKSGILFKPNNIDAIVSAIVEFINLSYVDKVKMGLWGRKKMEAQFDRTFIVSNYLSIIKNIGELNA